MSRAKSRVQLAGGAKLQLVGGKEQLVAAKLQLPTGSSAVAAKNRINLLPQTAHQVRAWWLWSLFSKTYNTGEEGAYQGCVQREVSCWVEQGQESRPAGDQEGDSKEDVVEDEVEGGVEGQERSGVVDH